MGDGQNPPPDLNGWWRILQRLLDEHPDDLYGERRAVNAYTAIWRRLTGRRSGEP